MTDEDASHGLGKTLHVVVLSFLLSFCVLGHISQQLYELGGVLLNCHGAHLQVSELFCFGFHCSFHEVVITECSCKLCPTNVGGIRVISTIVVPP
jgi:hypothetical protein